MDHLVSLNQQEPVGDFDSKLLSMFLPLRKQLQQPVQLADRGLRRTAFGGEATTDALDGRIQPFGLDRLQEVVDRVHVKRLNRMPIIRGDEDQLGLDTGLEEPPGDLEPGQPGHLDVEHDEIGGLRLNHLEGFDPVGGLAHDLDPRHLSEQEAHFFPRELLIVHDHRAQGVSFQCFLSSSQFLVSSSACGSRTADRGSYALIRAGASISGMTMRAHVPWPGTLSSWS